jgi:hypothetical protein
VIENCHEEVMRNASIISGLQEHLSSPLFMTTRSQRKNLSITIPFILSHMDVPLGQHQSLWFLESQLNLPLPDLYKGFLNLVKTF